MIPPRPFSVVVIGGGFAGLSAVQTLVRESRQQQQQAGISSPIHITLLEAKDRLGGRMHTVSLNTSTTDDSATTTIATGKNENNELSSSLPPPPVPPVVCDMGGMYFHGQGSVLKSLQEAFPEWKTIGSGGDSVLPGGRDAIFKVYKNNKNDSSSGMPLLRTTARDLTAQEKGEITNLFKEWMNDMKKRCHEFKNSNNNNDSVDASSHHPALLSKWSEEFCARVSKRRQGGGPDSTNEESEHQQHQLLLLLQGLEFYKRLNFDLDFAIAWPNVAMEGLMNDWGFCDLHGDDIISVDGMRTLINAMELQLEKMTTTTSSSSSNNDNNNNTPTLTIRKQTRVERIEYDMDCNQSSSSTSTLSKCRIITSDPHQTMFEADACICTIPLGVLKKRAMQLFVPPLPFDKLQALERAGVGTLNTLVVQWNKPIHCYCKTEEESSVGEKSNDDGTTSTLPSAYYLIGAADNNDDNNNRGEGGPCLAVVDANTNPLWHGFVCPGVLRNNEDATITQFHFYETENLPFDNLDFWKLQALQVVQAVVGNNNSQNDNKPLVCLEDIVDVQLSAWHLDPDVLGSYSAPTTKTRGNVDRKILAEPVVAGSGGLYFAGEHTHYEGRFATMDGAYETGIRAARQVLQQKADSGR